MQTNNEPPAQTAKELATEKLRHYVRRSEDSAISNIAVKDGNAYATDGRIAVKWRLPMQSCEDSIPEGYPLGDVARIIDETDSVPVWFRLDPECYKRNKDAFKREYLKAKLEAKRDADGRYKAEICPCCGDYIYWDTWYEKLVAAEDVERPSPLAAKDMDSPILLRFGNQCIVANLGYIITIMETFDAVFATDSTDGGTPRKILFKSTDGTAVGVLMGMLQDTSTSAEINAVECNPMEASR